MAKKPPSALWSLSAARLSGPQIGVASRPQLNHLDALAWVDDHHIATLEHDGLLRLWREDATLLAERTISGQRPQWTRSITRVRSGLLVHFQHHAWLLHPDTLAICAQYERVGDLALASGLLTLIDYHGALHTLDDATPALPTTGSIPLALNPRRPYGTTLFTAPDAPRIGLRSPDEAMTIDARDGRIRAIPAGYALLALHTEGRALLRTPSGHVGLHDLDSLQAVGPLASAPRDITRAARTAAGWLLAEWDARIAAARILRCIDDQGQERWRRHLSEIIQEIVPSPDGQRVALRTPRRALLFDASSGDALHASRLAPYTSSLLVTHDQLIAMTYERSQLLTDGPLASRFDLRGERLGELSPSFGVAVGDVFYGLEWRQSVHTLVSADLRSPELPPTPLTPIRPHFTSLCAARGHVYYDHYAGGAWTLRHVGPDAAGVWADVEIASLSKALPGACVVANDPAGLVAASAGAGPVTLYEAETGQQRWLLLGLTKGHTAAQFTRDGAALLAASGDKLLCWDTASGELRWKAKLPQRAERLFAALDASGERLILLSPQGALLAYTVATGHLAATAQLELPPLTAATVGHDDRLYLAAEDQQLYVAQLP